MGTTPPWSWTRHAVAFLAFVLPTLAVGFGWKYGLFRERYEGLQMHREDISMTLAFSSLFIQAGFWTLVCARFLAPCSWGKRTLRLFALACPLGWSFTVCMVGAKHVMTSVTQFAILETGFTLLMYAIVCPLMAAAYCTAGGKPPHHKSAS